MSTWERRKRPIRLEKRYEFQSYEETRDFLDKLGTLSEQTNRFPDISFGKKYVNITLRPFVEDENADILDEDYKFASEIDGFVH